MRLTFLFSIILGTLNGQVICPSPNWVASPTVQMADRTRNTASALIRLRDGSYTQRNYRATTLSPLVAQQQASVPRFEQHIYGCQGLVPPTPTSPTGWRRGADRLPGTVARWLMGGDFLGDGTAFGASVSPFTNRSMLTSGIFMTDGTLTNIASYSVGASVGGILAADLNGDGRTDMVVLNIGNFNAIKGSLSVFLTNPNGTLSAPSTVQLTTDLLSGTAADFNSDGKVDLALVSGSTGIVMLRGNGDGTFAAPVAITTTVSAYGIIAVDFTGDGKLDLAFGSNGAVVVLPGNNDGTFQAARVNNRGGNKSIYYLGAGDFNRDNKLDLATAGVRSAEVGVALGNGDGTFAAPSYYVVPTKNEYFFVSDFDWDGKTDIVMAEGHPDSLSPNVSGPYITVLLGKGDGSFHGMRSFVATNVVDLAVGDLNGDGKPDAVAAGFSGIAVQLAGAGGDLRQTAAFNGNYPSVTLADLNRDGRLDIAGVSGNNIVTIQGNGDGTFQTPLNVNVGTSNDLITSGDVNGDNVADLVAARISTGVITVYVRSAAGAITTGATFPAGSVPNKLQLADLDGDGRLDLVATNTGTILSTTDIGSVVVFKGNGNGTFQSGVPYVNGVNPAGATLADVNGDGKLDLLASAGTTTLGTYRVFLSLNRGDGTFGQATPYATDYGPGPIAVADFDLDGRKDLVVTHCCGETDLGFMAGNGDGTFQAEKLMTASGRDQSKIAVVDWNGDGKPGLLVATLDRLISFVNRSAAGASVVTPAPGSTLGVSPVTFTWSAVAGATKYKLEIGNAAGGSDLFSQETTGTSLAVSNLPSDGRTLYVQVTAYVNGAYGSPSATTYRSYTAPVPLRFVPLAPCRVMETRAAYNFEGRTGAFGPPSLTAGSTRTLNLPVSNVCSIPASAKAYVVNVTVIPNGGGVDFVTVWAAGDPRPNVWTIRSPDGQAIANSAIVKAGTSGGINVYSSSNTDLLIDISGYYTDSTAVSGLVYYPLTPCRVIDTRIQYRTPAGPFGPPSMAARETRRFRFPSTPYCTVPEAAAYSVTITAVPPGPLAYLTAWPSQATQPNVSSINSFAGRVLANSVIVPAAGGSIDVFTFDATDFLVDINGYYAPDNGQGLFYYNVTPCRASDSTASGGTYPADTARTINVPGASGCSGIPTTARGYALNVTALPNGNPVPFITAYPTGQPRPNASILNAFQGQIVSNSAIIPAGTNGAVDIYTFQRTDVVVEISGYFGR